MNTFSKIILSSVVTLGSLFTGVEAQARNYCYETVANDYICIHWVKGHNRYPQEYKMAGYSMNGSYYEETFDCNRRNGVNQWNYKNNLSGKVCFEYE